MRHGRWLWALMLLVPAAGGLALLPGAARAEDEAGKGVWVYDVRIARTSCDAQTGLHPSPWEAEGPMVGTTWASQRAELEKRGAVSILMDDRLTAVPGSTAQLSTEKSYPTVMLQSQTDTGRTMQGTVLRFGCNVSLETGDALDYEIEVNWPIWPLQGDPVPSARTKWQGAVTPLEPGKTLVLYSRQHVRDADGKQAVAEIYCFVSGRLARSR